MWEMKRRTNRDATIENKGRVPIGARPFFIIQKYFLTIVPRCLGLPLRGLRTFAFRENPFASGERHLRCYIGTLNLTGGCAVLDLRGSSGWLGDLGAVRLPVLDICKLRVAKPAGGGPV